MENICNPVGPLLPLVHRGLRRSRYSQYLHNLIIDQAVNRAVNASYHNEPFYYYFNAILYSLAPWSLLYLAILLVGIKNKLLSTDLELFFLVIAGSTLVLLSIFSSKLAVYLLPTFPFLVYLCVLWISKLGSPKWVMFLVSIPAILLLLALPAVILLPLFDLNSSSSILVAGFILSLSGIIALKYVINYRLNRGIQTMGAGILLAVFMISFAIPQYNSMIGLGKLCEEAKTISSQKGAQNYYYCKITRADNLDVYLGLIPKQLMIHDLFEADGQIKKPAILFLSEKSIAKNDSLQLFIKGKKIHHLGNYYCVEVDL